MVRESQRSSDVDSLYGNLKRASEGEQVMKRCVGGLRCVSALKMNKVRMEATREQDRLS